MTLTSTRKRAASLAVTMLLISTAFGATAVWAQDDEAPPTPAADAQDELQDAAGDAQDAAQDVEDAAQDAAGDVQDDLQDAAGDAQDAAQDVQDDVEDAAGDAQDAAQDVQDDATASEGHWVAIHVGTCEEPGRLLFPLGRITTDLRVHSSDAEGRDIGMATDQQLSVNVTIVDAALDDLGGADHALNVREEEDESSRSVACADIGGTVLEGDTLIVRLDEENDSGEIGVAVMREIDGLTTVYSVLTDSSATVRSPMPAPTPSPDPTPEPDDELVVEVMIDPDDGEVVDVDVDEASPAPDELSPAPEESPAT